MFSILNRALSWTITSSGNKFCLKKRSRLIKALNNMFYVKFMQLEIGLFSFSGILKLQLHDAIYRLRFYSNSLIHILSLSNSHNDVASIQKNRGDKSHRVIVALGDV